MAINVNNILLFLHHYIGLKFPTNVMLFELRAYIEDLHDNCNCMRALHQAKIRLYYLHRITLYGKYFTVNAFRLDIYVHLRSVENRARFMESLKHYSGRGGPRRVQSR